MQDDMMPGSPSDRSQRLRGSHRIARGERLRERRHHQSGTYEHHGGQQRFNQERLGRHESKLLIERSMNSLIRIVAEDKKDKFRESVNRDVSVGVFGNDVNSCVPPPPALVWDESDSSQSTAYSFYEEDFQVSPVEPELSNEFRRPSSHQSEPTVETVEVSPGHCLPLRRAEETWKAFAEGRTIQTPCFLCEQELTCVEDAEILACSECGVFSPIERFDKRLKGYGVCMGVGTAEIQSWILEKVSSPTNKQCKSQET